LFLLDIFTISAYQITRLWGYIVFFFVIGIIGWIMSKLEWSRAAVLIGFVLATPVERYLWISISRYEYSWITNPGVIIIGVIIIFILVGGTIFSRRQEG